MENALLQGMIFVESSLVKTESDQHMNCPLLTFQGLASHKSEESCEYFWNFSHHLRYYIWKGESDGNAIRLAFTGKMSKQCRVWMLNYSKVWTIYGG